MRPFLLFDPSTYLELHFTYIIYIMICEPELSIKGLGLTTLTLDLSFIKKRKINLGWVRVSYLELDK